MYTQKLKQIYFFNSLNEEEIKAIESMSVIKKLQRDEILFYEGETAKSFYFLLEGKLKLYKTNSKANEIVLHLFQAPTMVAEMATIEDIPFPATARAQTNNTFVAVIEKEKFLNLLEITPKLSWHIIKSLTSKIKTLEKSINRNLVLDATAKVCSLLQENHDILQTHKNIQIANILNITPETLSRTLRKLKDLRVLDDKNNLIDQEKLELILHSN
ncbi:Crp/Fnr family transcriptional regulator [Sulfurimonas sp. C5]|uniref:Crp/Fnr family transcriptional regulator n=1 Tax=Sulfurimonas sp. C5 TaxID=3036947 RepID=UPI0024549BE5|nr:Crp/Fnr family transcriptional regulator [Sulfurimonas sp. C5]MDH4944836.1 Crp/Fnr family transcriptional regulator [Sulfurimonas sp. C5]